MDYDNEEYDQIDILRRTTYLLIQSGFQAHQRGYRYLREAIAIVYDSPDMISSVTKMLYPEIAKMYDTTDKQVERAIRNAIETAWLRGNADVLESLFGEKYYDNRPTNSEVIQTYVNKLLA